MTGLSASFTPRPPRSKTGILILPAAGFRRGGTLGNAGSNGDYWSASLDEMYPRRAWYFFFHSGYQYVDS